MIQKHWFKFGIGLERNLKLEMRGTKPLLVILLAAFLLCGCSTGTAELNDQEIHGTLSLSGAWALYPMVIRWAEEFQRVYPEVEFDISAGGAGKGMADVLAGAVDIGMVSRAIHSEELDQGAFWIMVTKDAVVATVNATNPLIVPLDEHGVPPSVLRSIWQGELTTWGEVVSDSTVAEEIHVYTRSDACGAAETWAAFLGDLRQEDLQGVAVYGDPGLAEVVVQDPLGIGYNNLNFAFDAETRLPVSGLKILAIDMDGNGSLSEDEQFYITKDELMTAIADGRYPSPPARGLNLVTQGKPDGLALLFIQWVLVEGQKFTEETGYIPLTDEQRKVELLKLE